MSGVDPTRCDRIKPNGEQCRRSAGWVTDHKGVGRCRTMEATPQADVKAAARAQLASLTNEVDIDPQEVLLRAIRLDWGAVQWCGEQIRQAEELMTVSDDPNERLAAEKRLYAFESVYGEWIDRAAKRAKLALDAGVEERRSAWQSSKANSSPRSSLRRR